MTDVDGTKDQVPAGTTELAVWRPLPILPARQEAETAIGYVARLMELLPPQTEDVVEAIAEQLLSAGSMMDQNAVWDATGSREAVNRQFIFHSCHLQPSDHKEGRFPFYLVCKVTDPNTGEPTVLTTGSVNIMTQLVPAQVLGRLPWQAEIVGPRRPTASGHVPLHLRWIAKVSASGDVEEVPS